MNKARVLILVGNRYIINKVAETGIEVISKTLPYEEILAEVHATDATHIVLHDAYLNGGPYRTRLEQLRCASGETEILIITGEKKPDAVTQKAYTDNRMRSLPESVNGLTDKIIQFINDYSTADVAEASHPIKLDVTNQPESDPTPDIFIPTNSHEATRKELKQAERLSLAAEPPPAPPKSRESLKKERKQLCQSNCNLHPPPATVVIPVFSGNKGAGCTWLCVQMATYLTSRGMNCAVSGSKEIMYFSPKGELSKFSTNGIDFYGQSGLTSLLTAGYDYILLDVGQIINVDADHTAHAIATPELITECQRAPNKYMVTDYMLGRGLVVEEIMGNSIWRNIANNCTILLSPRQSDGLAKKLSKRYKRQILTLPVCAPFALDERTEAFLEGVL